MMSRLLIVRRGSACGSRSGSSGLIFRGQQQRQLQCNIIANAMTTTLFSSSSSVSSTLFLLSSSSSSLLSSSSLSSVSCFSTSSLDKNDRNSGKEQYKNKKNKNHTHDINYQIAIVGSGPSGCYTAKYLLLALEQQHKIHNIPVSCSIDIIERLPTPYGLVRNGVAPDHQEVKNVQHDFDQLFETKNKDSTSTNSTSNNKIRFFGNVTVGGHRRNDNDSDGDSNNTKTKTKKGDISLQELRSMYDIVVLAYGCESDRELNLPVDIIDTNKDGTTHGTIDTRNDTDTDTVTTPTVEANTTNTTSTSTTSTSTTINNIEGILSSRQFVNWYNGHPDFDWVTKKVQQALSSKNSNNVTDNNNDNTQQPQQQPQNIVIIGHGNVALDCARILAKCRTSLDPTDITTRAIDILRPTPPMMKKKKKKKDESADDTMDDDEKSEAPPEQQQRERNISIVGRRGHIQGAFTIKEVRELTKLVDTDTDTDIDTDDALFVVRKEELEMGMTPTSKEELKTIRPKQRIHKLFTGHATKTTTNEPPLLQQQQQQHNTIVNLRFLMNPVRYEVVQDNIDNEQQQQQQFRLKYVVCERTQLVGDTIGSQQAIGTGVYEKIKADLCLVSIGYKGLPLDESDDDDYSCTVMKHQFDSSKGILRNTHGRVTVNDTDTDTDTNMAPVYVSGWLKRGPSGIIGTNIGDAKDTVQSIIQDISIQINNNNSNIKDSNNGTTNTTTTATTTTTPSASSSSASSSLEDILQERNVDYVTWDGYRNIDSCESYGSSRSSSSVVVDDDDDNSMEAQERTYHHKRHPDQPREKIVCWETLIQVATTNIPKNN